jgi:hypothetical protein
VIAYTATKSGTALTIFGSGINIKIDGEVMAVGTLGKGKQTNKLRNSGYGFNFWKFLVYTLWNLAAVFLGSVISLAIALIVYVLKLESLAAFNFTIALQAVMYDWLYDDVFIAILTLGTALVITYIVSFRRESDEYFGTFSKVVDWVVVTCVVLCFIMIALEIIYALHSSDTTVGNLTVYNAVEIIALLVCGFLQSFSHPEYYMSPKQIT